MNSTFVSLVTHLLENDRDAERFERFANEAVGYLEGTLVAQTARSHDAGVDGRPIVAELGAHPPFIVRSSVRRDADAKVSEDISELVRAHKDDIKQQVGERNYFVSSRIISDEVRARLQVLVPHGLSAIIIDRNDLASAVRDAPDLFFRHYSAEARELTDVARNAANSSPSPLSLQIAAALYGSEDGLHARDSLLESLVLRAIATDGAGVNRTSVPTLLQSVLRLSVPFPRESVESACERLLVSGLLAADAQRLSLTAPGRELLVRADQRASAQDQLDRATLAEELKAQLGFELSRDEFDAVWQMLLKRLAHALMLFGDQFLLLASGFLASAGSLPSTSGRPLIRDAVRQAAAVIQRAEVREELELALENILLSHTGSSRPRIIRLCTSWLALCALGVSAEASSVMRQAVRSTVLILDTDVVLSLLCWAEEQNESLTSFLRSWNDLGGRCVVFPPVLQEVAHHAWIAQDEHADVATFIQRVPYDSIPPRSIAHNAFVRTFWAERGDKSPKAFVRFLSTFRGSHENDARNITRCLRDLSLGIEPVTAEPVLSQEHRDCEAKASQFLARLDRRVRTHVEEGKSRRDSLLVGQSLAHLDSTETGSSRALFVTSSRKLRFAVRHVFGERGAVHAFSPSELGGLLSLAPRATVTVSSVASLLISEQMTKTVSSLDLTLTRLLEESGLSAAVPPARLVTLRRNVENETLRYAKTARTSPSALLRAISKGDDREAALTVVAEAAKKAALVAGPGVMPQLIQRITELEREKAALQAQLRGLVAPPKLDD